VHHRRRLDALDGNDDGVKRLFIFTCSARGGPITCRNALGNEMRDPPG